ncbi:MAG: sigma-54-dependent Fis family transcriptional regulator [Myxococcales bacterium]|nr:MAG: sigma-54-dependent Fis family transcriptional regulator [Myxococcales bacterium]
MTEPTITLLVVDDELSNRESLEKIFTREGFRVLLAGGAQEALELCRNHVVDIVLSDLMMPGMSGLELSKALKVVAPDTEIVLMTAYGTIETAVQAMRQGAYDFVEKPLKRMNIVKTVRKAAERAALLAENRHLKRALFAISNQRIIGSSPALRRALDTARQAAPSSATVLLLGQSGTGKELLARYIHEHSERQGEFVAVNLAALPETIVEAELFGHERGAFTGAMQKRIGRIAQANRGTLFLDEIGELPAAIQVKLLRVLQDGMYEPLGGSKEHADFRLIAATNRDLESEVNAGRFREDLYYRLNVIAITSPPLSDRRNDIPLLVDHFLDLYSKKNNKATFSFSSTAMEKMLGYGWPGNVRELENVIERIVVLNTKAVIDAEDLPPPISDAQAHQGDLVFSLGTPLAQIERAAIVAALRHSGGDKQLAAQLLGISARTIYRKLEEKT